METNTILVAEKTEEFHTKIMFYDTQQEKIIHLTKCLTTDLEKHYIFVKYLFKKIQKEEPKLKHVTIDNQCPIYRFAINEIERYIGQNYSHDDLLLLSNIVQYNK